MVIRSDRTIYRLLEKKLRNTDTPLTCAKLMDDSKIREEALKEFGGPDRDVQQASNKLSDALGFMWRRGLLTRFPAGKDDRSMARYSYVWDKKEDARPIEPTPSPVVTKGKMGFLVNEYGDGVLIEFEKFVVWVRPKQSEGWH